MNKRICEWWRHDGCAHDPTEPGCTWPNCPTTPVWVQEDIERINERMVELRKVLKVLPPNA
jgi:hypothetical protein